MGEPNIFQLLNKGYQYVVGRAALLNTATWLCLGFLFIAVGCSSNKGGGDGGEGGEVLEKTNRETNGDFSTLGAFYFMGSTKSSGSELWKSNGTDPDTSMVREINMLGSSHPANFTEVTTPGGVITYFTADDNVNGTELWKTDAGGTSLVKDIRATGGSNPNNLLANDDKLVFTARNDAGQSGLWESDGTDSGTVEIGSFTDVKNLVSLGNGAVFFTQSAASQLWYYDGITVPTAAISPSTAFSGLSQLTRVGTQVFFLASTPASGFELWTSDGTDAGTVMVRESLPGTSSIVGTTFTRLFSVNDQLIFTENTQSDGTLWRSDGTEAGTAPLMDNAATPAPVKMNTYYYLSQASNGSDLYFAHFSNRRLWRTDGTSAGTFQVTTKVNGTIERLQETSDGKTFFKYSSSLWVTDGTETGTRSLSLNPGDSWIVLGDVAYYQKRQTENTILMKTTGIDAGIEIASFKGLQGLYSSAGSLYISANDGIKGTEPWVSDGTPAGTTLLADINTNPSDGSSLRLATVYNHLLYFVARNGTGRAVWKTDGTESGTIKISPDMPFIQEMTVSDDKLFFTGYDTANGYELWVTEGTVDSTHMVTDLKPGQESSYPRYLKEFNGVLYFVDGDTGLLWKTQGTEESTTVTGLISPRSAMVTAGDKLYFSANESGFGDELWVSDGTSSGTTLLKDINPTGNGISSYSVSAAKAIGNTLYFVANDGVNGAELWKTDGTEDGTQTVTDLNGSGDGLFDSSLVLAADDTLYFLALTEGGNTELWKTDGTESGTLQLTNFNNSGGYLDDFAGFEVFGGRLYFGANNGTNGTELWKTDGTVEGTVMVKDIAEGAGSNPNGFSVVNGSLFFFANDGVNGTALWKTNGTGVGTVMVKSMADASMSYVECLISRFCNDYYD